MADDLRATIEHFFGLIQLEFVHLREREAARDARLDSIDARLDAMQARLDAMEARLDAMEARFGAMEARLDAMHGEIGTVRSDLGALRAEMTERFISVDEQLRTAAARAQRFETRISAELVVVRNDMAATRDHVSGLTDRMKTVEIGVDGLGTRIDMLSDEMRQRFRAM
jgi:chromosome segregation ATPase